MNKKLFCKGIVYINKSNTCSSISERYDFSFVIPSCKKFVKWLSNGQNFKSI